MRIEFKDILDDRLLFSHSKLIGIRSYIKSKRDSVKPIREPLVFNVKGYSSASQAFKLARCISLKCKVNPAFLFNRYRVTLLRHLTLIVMLVVPRKSGRLADRIRYIILNSKYIM